MVFLALYFAVMVQGYFFKVLFAYIMVSDGARLARIHGY